MFLSSFWPMLARKKQLTLPSPAAYSLQLSARMSSKTLDVGFTSKVFERILQVSARMSSKTLDVGFTSKVFKRILIDNRQG